MLQSGLPTMFPVSTSVTFDAILRQQFLGSYTDAASYVRFYKNNMFCFPRSWLSW